MFKVILNLNFEITKFLNNYDIILFLNSIIRLNKSYSDIIFLYNKKYIKWNKLYNNIQYFPELRFIYDKYCFIIIKQYLNNNKFNFIELFQKEIILSNHINIVNEFTEITYLYIGKDNKKYYDYYYSYIFKTYNFNYIYDLINKYDNLNKNSIFIQCYLYENNILYDVIFIKNKYIKYPTNKTFINLKSSDTNYKIIYDIINS